MRTILIYSILLVSCTSVTKENLKYTFPTSANVDGKYSETKADISFEGEEKNGIASYKFSYRESGEKDAEVVSSNAKSTISVNQSNEIKITTIETFTKIDLEGVRNGSLREAFEECLFKLRELGIQIEKNWVSQPFIRELGTTVVFETSEDVEEKLNREYLQLLYNFSISYKVRKRLPNPKKEDIDKIKYYTLIGVVGAPSPPQPFKLGKIKGIIVYEENKEPQYFQITEDEWKIIEEFNNEKE